MNVNKGVITEFKSFPDFRNQVRSFCKERKFFIGKFCSNNYKYSQTYKLYCIKNIKLVLYSLKLKYPKVKMIQVESRTIKSIILYFEE